MRGEWIEIKPSNYLYAKTLTVSPHAGRVD